MRVTVVVGARPNFMKAAPVLRALDQRPAFHTTLVHTGQHYDENMSAAFLRDLDLRAPDVCFEVGSGSHARQTAEVLTRSEQFLEQNPQDLVVVCGDVNSTLAAALAAVKLKVPVAHVEAGLRSGDRRMPEEINRRVTDSVAALCFVTEPAGVAHLQEEGVEPRRIKFVGNTMIDTLLHSRDRALARPLPEGLPPRFGVVTLHRPSNVDDRGVLAGILGALESVQRSLPLCWPVHPRTRKRLAEFGLEEEALALGLRLLPPAGYLDFLGLVARASLVLTDSGGIQEEALVLRVPVVTLRDSTERPSTIDCGGNVLAGANPASIRTAAASMLARDPGTFQVPELWDGQAGQRIAEAVQAFLQQGAWL